MALSPDSTQEGRLPSFEQAKAYAFEVLLQKMAEHMGQMVYQLVGAEKYAFIAAQLTLKGGGARLGPRFEKN